MRVSAVGLCGSDLHWFGEGEIGDAQLQHPLVLGHEMAGVVESGRYVGQIVAIDPAVPCGRCAFCLEGNPNLCPTHRFAGHGLEDGGLREWIAWPEDRLFPLPPGFSDVEGVMLEPLGVALYAVDLGGLRPGMIAGVFGCGPIGLLIVQLVRLCGATQIIATDKLPHRVEAARSVGATHALLSDKGRENAEIWALTGHRGVDVAFEAANENDAVETAIAVAKPGGRVILVGIPADDRTTFSASTARRKGLTIQWCRRMKHTYPRAIRLVGSRLVDVRSLVSHRFPLEQATQAFATAQRREGLKVVITL